LKFRAQAPQLSGKYVLQVDLVDQHICWFGDVASQPFTFEFSVLDPHALI